MLPSTEEYFCCSSKYWGGGRTIAIAPIRRLRLASAGRPIGSEVHSRLRTDVFGVASNFSRFFSVKNPLSVRKGPRRSETRSAFTVLDTQRHSRRLPMLMTEVERPDLFG